MVVPNCFETDGTDNVGISFFPPLPNCFETDGTDSVGISFFPPLPNCFETDGTGSLGISFFLPLPNCFETDGTDSLGISFFTSSLCPHPPPRRPDAHRTHHEHTHSSSFPVPVLQVQLPQGEEDNGWTTVNVMKKDGQPGSIVPATKLHIVDKVDMEGGTGKISWTVRIGQGRTGPKRHLPLMVRRWVQDKGDIQPQLEELMLCAVWSHGRLSCVCCTTTSAGRWVLVKPLSEFNINQIVSINTTQAALPKNGQAIGQRFQDLFQERGSTMAKVVPEDQAVKVWQEKGKPMRGGKPKKKRGGADSSSSASSSTTSSSSSDSDESEDRKASKAGPNKTPRKPPKKHTKNSKTPQKTHVIKREHDEEMLDEGVVDRKRFRAGDTTVANLLARLQSDSAPQTGPLASCTKCSVTEGDLKVARAHCALLSWQLHDATKPLPSSLVEYQFQSITGEAMTTAHWDEFKKMLPETLR